MKLGRSTVALLITGLAVAACQQASPSATGSPSPTGGIVTGPPSSQPSMSSPTAAPSAASPVAGEVTLTGTVVFSGVEGGCWGLKVGTKTYELLGGDRAILSDGADVVVRGVVRSDLATICQIGTPLEVLSARAA
ncbi:hypothetical protein F4553_003332 [Allocatelliglobosispora scoriae]|uniref:DUF5666 domain-containing protein n=1 Tax=Allocatelliglobosispora scoriae TaxID=643052 RepID=A0A841BSQ6_9ACTN|nr:hypothetical protein [Allocatelliglobosispora scoriae]MBB5869953.1 hypothetical protein [Allocatelliglobosispora scoriae]